MIKEMSHAEGLKFMTNKEKKLVVITGVTQGLGRSMMDRFDHLGWTISGCGRSDAGMAKLREQFDRRHMLETADVTDEQAVMKWAEDTLQRFGPPDLLINNASAVNRNAPIWNISNQEFAQVMRVNVEGAVNVIRAFVPAMMRDGKGIIINISSSWGRAGEAGLAPYCASKFAIEGLTQSMALELPSSMAAVALDPGGGIRTAMLQTCGPQYLADSPTPQEWSQIAVPYILSLTSEDNGKSLTCPDVVK
jgi:NAD(P)-dependent dehydrogenase (short-subunit alcohol dehydrogenase family)